MIGDKGYDSDEYRAALKAKGITACISTPCIPPRKGRVLLASFDKDLYRKRRKVQNMLWCLCALRAAWGPQDYLKSFDSL